MKPSSMRIVALLLMFLVAIVGCSSGGGGDRGGGSPDPTFGTITGQAVKGPISGGTVTAYAVTAGVRGAVLNTAATDASGNYSLAINNYSGPVLLEVTGGSYVDEATGNVINIPTAVDSGLQAAVSNVTAGSNLQAQITPLTTMAAARALQMTGGLTTTNVNTANQQIGTYFGGINLLATQPVNPLVGGSATGATQAAIDYGLILAGLSQEAQTLGLPNPLDLILALVQDVSDGTFDGQSGSTSIQLNGSSMDPATGTAALATAINAFSSDLNHNVSGGAVSSSLINVPSNPAPTYTIGGTVSGLTGTGLMLQNNGGDNLAISANGSFPFGVPLTAGSAYNVTVATQPSGQTCTVSDGSGTVGSANITHVRVTCVTSGGGGNAYSMADLAGTWYGIDINTPQKGFSYPNYFGYDFDTVTLQSDGAGTYSCISSSDPCGDTEAISGLSISSEGLITTPLGPNEAENFVMGANKDIAIQIFRNNSAGDEHQVFGVSVKKAASYSMADLAGTWYGIDINTPQKGFSYPNYFGYDFDAMTLQSDGTGTYTCISSSDPCGASAAISGLLLSSDGIITVPPEPNRADDIVMGANKDIMIQIHRNNDPGDEHHVFGVFVKKATSYSMADLAGTWYSIDINTPQKGFSYPNYFGFDVDTVTLQSDGTGTTTCIASSDPCGDTEAVSGVSISPEGIVTTPLGPNEAENFVMGANKDIMIQIFRNNNAGDEHQVFSIFVKKAE